MGLMNHLYHNYKSALSHVWLKEVPEQQSFSRWHKQKTQRLSGNNSDKCRKIWIMRLSCRAHLASGVCSRRSGIVRSSWRCKEAAPWHRDASYARDPDPWNTATFPPGRRRWNRDLRRQLSGRQREGREGDQYWLYKIQIINCHPGLGSWRLTKTTYDQVTRDLFLQ